MSTLEYCWGSPALYKETRSCLNVGIQAFKRLSQWQYTFQSVRQQTLASVSARLRGPLDRVSLEPTCLDTYMLCNQYDGLNPTADTIIGRSS